MSSRGKSKSRSRSPRRTSRSPARTGAAAASTGSGGGASSGSGRNDACYQFKETGSCRYGDRCRFAHGM